VIIEFKARVETAVITAEYAPAINTDVVGSQRYQGGQKSSQNQEQAFIQGTNSIKK
jgi:hypothetical protein